MIIILFLLIILYIDLAERMDLHELRMHGLEEDIEDIFNEVKNE